MSETNGATHIGRQTTTEALGRTWTFSRWTRGIWDALAREASKYLPDPLAAMTRIIDAAALKDAEIIRKLMQADEKARLEYVAFRSANPSDRTPPPPAMTPRYRPTADYLAQLALDKASLYLGFQSRELNSWLQSPVGASFLFAQLLRPYHPDITEDQAFDIVQEIGPDEVLRVMEVTAGKAKEKAPNAEAPVG